jgi:diguanylate cyclase (GGDEF)-like protein
MPLAVLTLDMDRFKMVNDALGHDLGDLLLVEVGRRLRQTLRDARDQVVRLGGDEFARAAARCRRAAWRAASRMRIADALDRPMSHRRPDRRRQRQHGHLGLPRARHAMRRR